MFRSMLAVLVGGKQEMGFPSLFAQHQSPPQRRRRPKLRTERVRADFEPT